MVTGEKNLKNFTKGERKVEKGKERERGVIRPMRVDTYWDNAW